VKEELEKRRRELHNDVDRICNDALEFVLLNKALKVKQNDLLF
jgi:hypothetical protein